MGYAQDNPQVQNIFINQETQQSIDYVDIKNPSIEFHSAFKPYVNSTLTHFSDTTIPYIHFPVKNFFLSKSFNEGPNKRLQYNFQALPIIDLQASYNLLNSKFLS